VIEESFLQNYYLLHDYKTEYETDEDYALFVHVRPNLLICFAQILGYIIKAISKDHKSKNVTLINLLKAKEFAIAKMFLFQERLYLSAGFTDFIEAMQDVFKNEGVNFFPTKIFFAYDETQEIPIGEFEKKDKLAPSAIHRKDRSQWRRTYITEKLGVTVINPLAQTQLCIWQTAQAKNQVAPDIANRFVPTQSVVCMNLVQEAYTSIHFHGPIYFKQLTAK